MCQNSHVAENSLNPETVSACVPQDSISRTAYALASQHLPPAILNHCLRVWVYARALGEHEGLSSSRFPLLFAACILHDIGATPAFAKLDSEELQRFEIEGADAAASLLRAAGDPSISHDDIEEVWRAIALHSTPQIAERMGGLVRIVRLAVLSDFQRGVVAEKEGLQAETEAQFERLDIERVLADAVIQQALCSRMPAGKAPAASWPNDLLRAYRSNPKGKGVNEGF
ncbi:hypothetical protein GGU10DRAFT_268423 [Lentinula aff. detonsa]|uniref:HD/PDEase domain-containing protein n=1 Tax=Lentinula aff. detonsa TaxID=2804958 RepID=A0AA38KZL1_9AGAR|nr:hypothetical protein GGU10DRAFT_268423 [Lentinula aff. detonsa]